MVELIYGTQTDDFVILVPFGCGFLPVVYELQCMKLGVVMHEINVIYGVTLN